jgi:hypothetical protein
MAELISCYTDFQQHAFTVKIYWLVMILDIIPHPVSYLKYDLMETVIFNHFFLLTYPQM